MNQYFIEIECHTLLENNYFEWEKPVTKFIVEDISFMQKDYSLQKWSYWDKWIISWKSSWKNWIEARQLFYKKINLIISKISFIWQAYININNSNLLITKDNIWLFFYRENVSAVWLHFWKDEQDILKNLLQNSIIPSEFFYYWNDLINTTWYLAKILLLCSAIESLAKWENKRIFRVKLLWEELANLLFESGEKWLRHRLVHWDYFFENDFNKNYVEVVHKKIIEYFNSSIIDIEKKISNQVVNPQRHPFWNYTSQWIFIEKTWSLDLKLINVLNDKIKDKLIQFNNFKIKIQDINTF